MEPCNHEEADTRVFLHAQDMEKRNGIKKRDDKNS